jgi:assimilatory nitrate reductase catalytic subunit
VVLTSRQGSVEVPWREYDGLRRDTLFMPYHWPVANLLTADDLDPTSRIPGLKYTPVRLAPVALS